MPDNNCMASVEMPSLPPSVAISALSYPGPGSAAAATSTTVSSTSKKQEHLVAGRRKLQEYRKKKAEEKKSVERNRTVGSVSERPLPNTLFEEGLQKDKESFSIPFNEEVLVDGSSIIPEEVAKGHFRAGNLDGLDARHNEHLESKLQRENTNGDLSREVKDSLDLWIEKSTGTRKEDGNFLNNFQPQSHNIPDTSGDAAKSTSFSLFEATGAKFLPNDSVSSSSNAGESGIDRMAGFYNGKVHLLNKEIAGSLPKADVLGGDFVSMHGGDYPSKGDPTLSKGEDSIGILSDFRLANGEGDNTLRGSVEASPSFSSIVSLYNPLTAPAFPKEQGIVSLGLQREKIGQEQPDYLFDSFNGVHDMKREDAGALTEKQFLFAPSKQPSRFDTRETKSNFFSRPSDNFLYGPASASTSSILSIPLHASTAAVSGKTLTIPTSTAEQDIPSAAMLNGISTIRHGIGSPNQSQEIQRNSDKDDFAALEQHIADLTQEKFSLQRALDAARSLAETLAQENSALTEDFNSQGAVINQLQGGIERQAEEIKAQSLVLNGIMVEREKAQQESNSAVERSQILAGEVIGLEEKVLKLRSNELKLERDLESLKSENETCRRQLLTLEKDRQNLRSMVEALQEDKKLLQVQVRKKLATGSSFDSQTSSTKGVLAKESKDVSTSTDDLDDLQATSTSEQTSVEDMEGSNQPSERIDNSFEVASSSTLGHDQAGLNSLPALATLPVDHFRIINSIDTLIMELDTEKDSLIKSLEKESKKASELEALNAELSQKLEMQTQRLELAFAQNLAHEATEMVTNSNDEHKDNEFVDEGDEIVERVLGWIARLFPSGSSKRRTSKLL